eukprot:Hpha_TRINITY_DN29883_c0_g1::TRINITY_DN29883_c0_g1_i1::g.3023::m.3023
MAVVLYVVTTTGERAAVELPLTATDNDLRKEIDKVMGSEYADWRLTFGGQPLAAGPLADAGVSNECTIEAANNSIFWASFCQGVTITNKGRTVKPTKSGRIGVVLSPPVSSGRKWVEYELEDSDESSSLMVGLRGLQRGEEPRTLTWADDSGDVYTGYNARALSRPVSRTDRQILMYVDCEKGLVYYFVNRTHCLTHHLTNLAEYFSVCMYDATLTIIGQGENLPDDAHIRPELEPGLSRSSSTDSWMPGW